MTDELAARQDHDQRFKTLLMEFLGPFVELFFPEQARLLDFERVEWLENEAFSDPPEGKRRSLDLVCKVPLREPLETAQGTVAAGMVLIIHVEIESADSVEPFRKRMFQYFACLRQKYTDPILPIAVYLRVGLDGLGTDRYEERLGDFDVLRYNYFYVGLPTLEAEEVKSMAVTTYEKGLRKGTLNAIVAILEERFGSLPNDLREKLEDCPDEKIPEIIKRVSKAQSIEDLAGFDFEQ